jgi:hypothetical protein
MKFTLQPATTGAGRQNEFVKNWPKMKPNVLSKLIRNLMYLKKSSPQFWATSIILKTVQRIQSPNTYIGKTLPHLVTLNKLRS